MAQIVKKQKTHLGPAFWPYTVFLGILSLIVAVIVILADMNTQVLREAAVPADQIDALFKFLTVVATAIFIYVTGYLVYFAIVFHKPEDAPANAIGVQIHDAPKLELWWTIIPTILVAILGWFSVVIWQHLQTSPGDVLTVESIGHQFSFEFRYPRLRKSVYNDFHVPLNTPVTLHVTSADVIHSFWVPEVRIKADMVPGLINTLRFTPTQAGTYRIICTEFCGVAHGAMLATMHVDAQQDFGKWFATQAQAQGMGGAPVAGGGGAATGGAGGSGVAVAITGGQADAGKALFGQKCSACHSTGPFTQKIVGPGLGNLLHDPDHPKLVSGDDPTPANIGKILKNGYQGDLGVMPSAQANAISDKDIANLVAYLVSLSK